MKKRSLLFFLSAFIVLLLLILLNIRMGSVEMSLEELMGLFLGTLKDELVFNIICNIRLPRICAVILLGGALSVSGYLLQTFFLNPIAGPFVLGISSGAKLFVALSLICLLEMGIHIGALGMVLAAFLGALLVTGLVLLASARVRGMSALIVCGVMTGYICNAITDFVVTFADDSNIVNLHNWSMGSFSGSSWSDIRLIFCIVIPAMLMTVLFQSPWQPICWGRTMPGAWG